MAASCPTLSLYTRATPLPRGAGTSSIHSTVPVLSVGPRPSLTGSGTAADQLPMKVM
jgi:hypothetical protein